MCFRNLTFALAYMTAALTAPALAAPYVPADGNQVIERVPRNNDPTQQELERLRARLASEPQNLQAAAILAQRYIELGRATGDPRYFGYAQATLSPWWSQSAPPDVVRILRATLRQGQHQFAEALVDLDAVLKTNPGNAQAWLTKATILQVQGEHAKAVDSCRQLKQSVPDLVVATCVAGAASLNGQAQKSYSLLNQALQDSPAADPGIKVWSLTLLGEIAQRLGNYKAAEAHFRQALALDPSDNYLLGAYADLLLDQGKAAQAASLLKNHLRPDGLLLRYAQALKQQASPNAKEHIDILNARFQAAKLRGDEAHEREQARFELHLQDNPQAALQLAQKNWTVQKEPADARILLEAAVAGKEKSAAEPVLRWIEEKGLEDRALQQLAEKARALP